jgi:predicted dehydrogenase
MREKPPVSPRSTTRRRSRATGSLFGKVDVVSIAVPTPIHFEVAKECLEAGISVLVEKPLTSTLEEAREALPHRPERNVVLHVGHVE